MSASAEYRAGMITAEEYGSSLAHDEFWSDDYEEYREPCEWDLWDDEDMM